MLKHIDSSELSQRGFMDLVHETDHQLILNDRYDPTWPSPEERRSAPRQVWRHACNGGWMRNSWRNCPHPFLNPMKTGNISRTVCDEPMIFIIWF